MPQANTVNVKYIGRESSFVERNYQSQLTFDPGQSRMVPAELADKLLRHVDCFEISEDKPTAAPDTESTQAQLEMAKLAKEEADKLENNRQDLVDRINFMDKDSLQDWAKVNYGQVVPKTLSVENMRSRVVGMVDKFGMV